MPQVAAYIQRVIINPGHGLSNVAPGVFDEGASSCYGQEHEIVAELADKSVAEFPFLSGISLLETPPCSDACRAANHPQWGHLAYLVEWINQNAIHDRRGYRDFVLSLHMNEAERPEASGTLVVYGANAPLIRRLQAERIAAAVSAKLGIANRGAMVDSDTPRKHLAILQKTKPAALLIELGFINNAVDVDAVKSCGAEAVRAAVELIRSF